ncbi:MAG: transporter substrate-binding domain-containing protein [Bacteroidales bacterium]|nr:transporter substrate-binding domain-containing protein [Bacteroidales bacterium]
MHRTRHKLQTILSALVIGASLISCGTQTKLSGTPTIDRIQERGTLLVGTTGDYRPLSYREPETGAYWGFGIDVAGEIADNLGVSISYVPTSWPTLSADVQNPDLFDFAIGGITITDTRLETMDMSEGYLCNGKTILCRKEDAGKYMSLEDLNKADVRVMVNPGGLNEKFARENLPSCTLIVFEKNEEIPGKVAEGEADVMITEITEAPWYVHNDSRLAAPLLDSPFTHGQIGVLMRKGQDDLLKKINSIIKEMKSGGKLKDFHDKYGLVYGYSQTIK